MSWHFIIWSRQIYYVSSQMVSNSNHTEWHFWVLSLFHIHEDFKVVNSCASGICLKWHHRLNWIDMTSTEMKWHHCTASTAGEHTGSQLQSCDQLEAEESYAELSVLILYISKPPSAPGQRYISRRIQVRSGGTMVERTCSKTALGEGEGSEREPFSIFPALTSL